MSKSGSLRIQEIRDCFRLIGDCRDLGRSPESWHQRAFEGLTVLIGASAATGGEGVWRRPRGIVKPMTFNDFGFERHTREYFLAYLRARPLKTDPIFERLQRETDRLVTCTRQDLLSDQEWYRSSIFIEFQEPGGVDHQLTSVYQVSDYGAISAMTFHRPLGERAFSARQKELVRFFHGELGRLLGGALVSGLEPGPDDLSPRLRQTLAYLLEGDSEKQVAARLGLSHATTHQYVTDLYRRLNVRSRGQLMAFMAKRFGAGKWIQVQDDEQTLPHLPSGQE